MHAYTHTHAYIHPAATESPEMLLYAYMHTYIRACMHARMHAYTHTHAYVRPAATESPDASVRFRRHRITSVARSGRI
jgi:hypothetical protein